MGAVLKLTFVYEINRSAVTALRFSLFLGDVKT